MSFDVRVLPLAGTLLLVVAPAGASEEDERRARARALLAEAVQLRDEGRDEESLEKLRAAYEAFPSPSLHFNFGLAYLDLGRDPEAAESFARFLAEAPAQAPRRDEATSYLEGLRARLGTIEVVVDAEGAEIALGGQPRGPALPGRLLHVRPGPHRIRVTRPGVRAHEEQVTVAAGERLRLMVRMASEPPATAPGPAALVTLPPAPDGEAAARARPLHRRWWFWTAAAIVVGGGALAMVLASQRRSDALCECNGGVIIFK